MTRPRIYLEAANMNWPRAMLPLWQQWFDVAPHNQRQDLSIPCVVECSQQLRDAGRDNPSRVPGARIDLMVWDRSVLPGSVRRTESGLELAVQDWVWMHEHCWCRSQGYDSQTREPYPGRPDRLFLMLMNLQRRSRDQLRAALAPWLDSSLHSYVEQGIVLPGDRPIESHGYLQGDRIHGGTKHDRHFCADWYSRTAFSMVSETTVDTSEWGWPSDQVFVSEKSFKPAAFRHPAVIMGTAGTLAYLRQQGFATWDHIIDENYDNIDVADLRLAAVVKQVDALGREFARGHRLFRDGESLRRLEHNYHWFYNQQRIQQMFYEQIACPILEFLNS